MCRLPFLICVRDAKLISFILVFLAVLSGCKSPFAVAPTPVPSPVIPSTASPSPTATSVPATVTYTPVPTRTPTPVDLVEHGAPTATWTPVPGHPVWSVWEYGDIIFELPVTWRRVTGTTESGALYEGPGGHDRPRLLLEVIPPSAETDAESHIKSQLSLMGVEWKAFRFLGVDVFPMAGKEAVKSFYEVAQVMPTGVMRDIRIVLFDFKSEEGLSLLFVVDRDRFLEWADKFDHIAASVRMRG